MRFPRNARIFRGQLDATPFASVFFLLLIFILMATTLYTPGVRLELPRADDLPGTDQPTLAVALDKTGRYYFENQVIDQLQLQSRLREAVSHSDTPFTLIVHADKEVTEESLVDLALLARKAGIYELLLATRPPLFSATAPNPATPIR